MIGRMVRGARTRHVSTPTNVSARSAASACYDDGILEATASTGAWYDVLRATATLSAALSAAAARTGTVAGTDDASAVGGAT